MKNKNIVFVIALLVACSNSRVHRVPPEQAATQFATDLGLKLQGKPNCTQIDSDYDGYVSCTVAIAPTDNQPVRLISLQCADLGNDGCQRPAEGCKETQPKVRAQSGE